MECIECNHGDSGLPALPGLFFLVIVNGNRIQIFGLEHLAAIEAAHVIHTIATIEKFCSPVLTSLHSEIRPILV